MSSKIAKIVVGLPVEGPFDYSVPEPLREKVQPGMRVLVLFNRRRMLGYITGFAQRSAFKRLNPILDVLDAQAVLGGPELSLASHLSRHYGCSLGEAIEAMLPVFLRKKKFFTLDGPLERKRRDEAPGRMILLTDASAYKRWEILLPRIAKVIAAQQSVLFLVPENKMIKGMEQFFKEKIDCDILILENKCSAKKEEELWQKILGGEGKLVLGTRSAIFAPSRSLGLIIVWDEENPAYKQEQSPYYQAGRVAEMRHQIEGCDLVYVSSAPTAESWHKFQGRKHALEETKEGLSSAMKLVDLTNYNPQKTSRLSFPLQVSMEKTLREQGKVLLFMNRKGFFTMTSCNECGFVLKCGRCDVNLTYLFSQQKMVCKHCNYNQALPKFCPSCKGNYLRSVGIGVEKLQSEAARLYPQARVRYYNKESKVYPHKADIVIATQAVLGLQGTVHADLVGVISFDAELNYFDFRSGQRAFTLLARLRQMARQTLLVQTSMMDNYIIRAALKMDYEKFYREELALRKEIGLPPFRRLVYIISRGKEHEAVLDYSHRLFEKLVAIQENPESAGVKGLKVKGITVSESHPDVHPKLRDQYRFSIMLQGPSLTPLLDLAKSGVKKTRGKKSIISSIRVDY